MTSCLQYVCMAMLLSTLCLAQETSINYNTVSFLPSTDPRCNTGAWTVVDRTASYTSGFTGPVKICVRSYMDVCNAVTGVVACNKATSVCQNVGYDYKNTVLFPNVQNVGVPQVCVTGSKTFLSDSRVLSVAQIIFAFGIYIPTFLLIAYVAWQNVASLFPIVILFCQLIFALLLSFSFFYLSGLIKLAGSFVAIALFREKCPFKTGLGLLFLIAVYFWSTFRWGLGHVTHDRFTAPATAYNFFQDQCNNFYSGHFTFSADLYPHTTNPALGPDLICSRYWVAGAFFFEFLSQLALILLAAAGIFALPYRRPNPVTVVKKVVESANEKESY